MPVDHEPQEPGLRTYLTSFIGRQQEIASVRQLLGDVLHGADRTGARASERLVTLSGVGGCGKTRLALEVARSFCGTGGYSGNRAPDGVRLVELAPVTDGAQLPQVVAAALHLREAAGVSPLEAVVKDLKDRRTLLVIDNCEHLAAACRHLINVMLPACPGLVVLTTSRAPLQVAGETVFAVPPLRTAEDGSPGAGNHPVVSEAAQLFLDRAATGSGTYRPTPTTAAAINQICQRLDGLPLAIELAASWMRVLTGPDLLAEIDRSISFLSSSAPALAERHRSMRAVLDSSWQRLAEQDQQVFSALAVFSGSFSREAAEVVTGGSLPSLSALAEKSLIQRLPDFELESRYHLHELVRQYALTRLQESDVRRVEGARRQHFDYFLALVEQAEEAWDTAGEGAWLDRLRIDQSNVNAALGWALDHEHTEEALRMSGGLYSFWTYTSPLGQYRPALERALLLPSGPESPSGARARAKALNLSGYAAVASSNYRLAVSRFNEALALYRQLDDERGTAWSLRGRSYAQRLSGGAATSRVAVEQSLTMCRATGDDRGVAWSVNDLGETAVALGDLDQAQTLLREGLRRFEELGVAFGAYRALVLLADVHRRQSQWLQALDLYEQALVQQRQTHFVARCADILEGLASIALALRQPRTAVRLLGAGHAWRETFGFPRFDFFEAEHERLVAAVKDQLGSEAYANGYDQGRALSSEQATSEAQMYVQELGLTVRARDRAGLTHRELEVLRALALGLSSPEIAEQLVVSPRTVHAHLRSIFAKLDVSTRMAAAREATRRRLL